MLKGKIEKILKTITGEEAVIVIFEILQPVFEENKEDLTQKELDFCLIETLECEVNSGGFNSFFYNSYGNLSNETLSALKNIGSMKFKDIFEKAIGVFKDSYVPIDINERIEIIDSNEDEFDEIWDELDDEFYKYEENIHELLLEYVQKHKSDFR